MSRVLAWTALILLSLNAYSQDSLSYSGRIVNANGSPVAGPVNLKFDMSYTNNPSTILCSKTLNNVPLSNGVFHTKLDYSVANCGGTNSLLKIMSLTPSGESLAIQVTDLSHTKTYPYQAIYSVPFSMISLTSKNLDQMSATPGQVLKWNGTQWAPAAEVAAGGEGTVTQVSTGTGLSGGPFSTSGTIFIANGGVDNAQLATGAVNDSKVAVGANINRTKLAVGTPNHVLINDLSGAMSSTGALPVSMGGTGSATALGARSSFGLGTAAIADVGNNIGNVMAADSVPSCFDFQKLQMSMGPVYAWTCAIDEVEDTSKLPLAGGIMNGTINMNTNQIVNLPSPTLGHEAANKSYVDDNEASNKVYVDNHTAQRLPNYKIRTSLQTQENTASTGFHANNCGGNEVYVMLEGLIDSGGDPITDMGFCIETTLRTADSWEEAKIQCESDSKNLPREFQWQIACERGLLTDASEDWEWASPATLGTTKGNYYAVASSPTSGECSYNFWYLPFGPTNTRNSLRFRCVK